MKRHQPTFFERMAQLAAAERLMRETIAKAQPGDIVPATPPKLDIRPAFTGAGKTSFKPARGPKRGK